jgi:hypothetical protein
VTTATVAFALEQFVTRDEGMNAVEEAGKVIPLNMSQSDGSTTITLDYAYADANRITIGYTYEIGVLANISHSAGTSATLMDAEGLPFVDVYSGESSSGGGGGGGGGGNGPTPTPSLMLAQQNMVQSYDAARISGAPERIALTLEIEYQAESDIEGEAFNGKMRFGFEIPFNPGLEMDTPQTVSANEVDLTLQGLIVAPSMTRAVICMRSDAISFEDYATPQTVITVNGEEVLAQNLRFRPDMIATPDDLPGNCRIYVIPNALDQYSGEWTMTIERLISSKGVEPAMLRAALANKGISFVDYQDDGSYVFRDGSAISPEEVDALIQQVQAIDESLRESWDGPWAFTFSLPG